MATMEILHRLSGFRREDFLEIDQHELRTAQWQPWFLTDRDKKSNLYRKPSIVSVLLAMRFQRKRLKCEKLKDNGQQMPSDGKNHIAFGKVS
jgi:hypothetical protein